VRRTDGAFIDAREESGMNQRALAEQVGGPETRISDMLNGRLPMVGMDALNRALAVFGKRIGTGHAIEDEP
jgi:predicted XRE-type DNA-binding protein